MKNRHYEAVVIGTSAGGIQTLLAILPTLPQNYQLPVIVVIHLPADKESILAEVFGTKCNMRVKEAEDKEPIEAGTIYFAPPGYHLLVESNKHLSLSCDMPVFFSRPSIDMLFETAADVYGDHLIGVILTGANNDGANGLKAIADAGGTALVQEPKLAYVATMPEAAHEKCPDAPLLSLEHIASFLQQASVL